MIEERKNKNVIIKNPNSIHFLHINIKEIFCQYSDAKLLIKFMISKRCYCRRNHSLL